MVKRLDNDTKTDLNTLTQIARRKPKGGKKSSKEKVCVLGPGYAVPISLLIAKSAVSSGKN